MEFSYHRRAAALRALTAGLAMAVAFDALIVVVLYVVLPPPWNVVAAVLGVLVTAGTIMSMARVFRTRHRVLGDRIVLAYGGFQLEVPKERLAATCVLSPVSQNAAAAEMWPAYRPDDDTLYITPHREGLVELKLAEPLSARLSRFVQPVQFTRIVLALDKPEAFLAALNAGQVSEAALKSKDADSSLDEAEPGSGGADGDPGGSDPCSTDAGAETSGTRGADPDPELDSAPTETPAASPAPVAAAAPPPDPVPITTETPPLLPPSITAKAPPPGPAPTSTETSPLLPPSITAAALSPAAGSAGPGAGESAAIVLERLTKHFGDYTAVNGVSLTVRSGEILAFLGSNGAGKTTTIRMMTGLLRPSAGRVLIHGLDVWKDGAAARRLIGYVPDTPILYESLTAQEFLWFIGGLYGLDSRAARARAEELLETLQMAEWRDQLIRSFSLGMRRKMSIAAALMHRPRVLLLDEVTNGLDPRSARVVKDLILDQAQQGASVFLTTHILEVASELAHRFAFIDGGRVLAVGNKEEVEELLGLAGASLEEIFLALTGAPPGRSNAG